jgi:hypothetical protein
MMGMSDTQQYGVIILCPAITPEGEDSSVLVSWNELIFYPKSVFLQADIPFKVNLAKAFKHLSSNPLAQKALFHCLMQEFNVDRYIITLLIGIRKDLEASRNLEKANLASGHLASGRAIVKSGNCICFRGAVH